SEGIGEASGAAGGDMTAKADAVRSMFTRIATRYDLMNTLMTGGRHHAWRRRLAPLAAAAPPGPALDLATRTADLARALQALDPKRPIVGGDFSEGMLREARLKLGERRASRGRWRRRACARCAGAAWGAARSRCTGASSSWGVSASVRRPHEVIRAMRALPALRANPIGPPHGHKVAAVSHTHDAAAQGVR